MRDMKLPVQTCDYKKEVLDTLKPGDIISKIYEYNYTYMYVNMMVDNISDKNIFFSNNSSKLSKDKFINNDSYYLFNDEVSLIIDEIDMDEKIIKEITNKSLYRGSIINLRKNLSHNELVELYSLLKKIM